MKIENLHRKTEFDSRRSRVFLARGMLSPGVEAAYDGIVLFTHWSRRKREKTITRYIKFAAT